MKNARLAGGLAAIGIGLVTIGIGQYSSQSHAIAASPHALVGDGATHTEWTWISAATSEYYAIVTNGTEGQTGYGNTVVQIEAGDWSVTCEPTISGSQVSLLVDTAGVEIIGGDFTFPSGSTMLTGESETVSLQGMHAQVQGHAGLHVQNTEDMDALTKRIEQLEAIIESLPECACSSDLNRDGLVNGADLGVLLAAWGPCTP
jgi:hypothetical protein